MRTSLSSSSLVLASILTAGAASAQETAGVAPMQPASTAPMPVPEDLLQPHPGGLTADQVGQRAMETSFQAKQALETMRAAEARVDAAWAAFLPRLSGTARYTRLSNFTPPPLFTGTGSSVGTLASPTYDAQGNPVPLPAGTPLYAVNENVTIPLILNQTLLQATLTLPISDYFLRINQNYTSATRSADAAKFDLGAQRATQLTNAKVAYYTWMQMRGAIVVAVEALNDQRIHLNDAKNQFTVGNASKADVLRAETNVASAELAVVTAENQADLAETQMRIALHAPPEKRLVPGEGLDTPQPTFQGNLRALVDEGIGARYEIKSALANARAAKLTSDAQTASRYPVVSAFGDAVEGNPNPRYFPATQTWFPTWDVGVQATWSPNDVLTANGNASDYVARAAALEAQAQVTREGIEVEITTAFQQVRQYEFALESTRRELASAEEAYRVARELFNNGRGTSTTLTDAERDLAGARIDALNARVNARIARVKLEHAVGRDLRQAAPR